MSDRGINKNASLAAIIKHALEELPHGDARAKAELALHDLKALADENLQAQAGALLIACGPLMAFQMMQGGNDTFLGDARKAVEMAGSLQQAIAESIGAAQ